MKVIFILLSLIALFSCNQRNENKPDIDSKESHEIDWIEFKTNSIVLSANPDSDKLNDKKALESYFSQLQEMIESSSDTLVIAKSRTILSKKSELIALYDKKTKSDKLSNSEKKDNSLIGKGIITSIADGFDVQRVNVWSSVDPNSRRQIGYLSNGDKVDVLESSGDYYLIYSKSKNLRGYLMKGFVVNIR